ncbi:MAG TPA: FCD domain-containing protein [Rhodocyclaceae bacterium]|nr:FCD domain-containing protein [Rhodocyclaceae bacterium]
MTSKASLHVPRRSEAIHRELERRILDGELPSGEKLPTEHALAEQFSVSRSVVREVVARLCAEGLVETRQGSGTFVAKRPRVLSFERMRTELLQVMELRRIVEVEAAGLAAERRSEADLAAIRASLDAMDKALASGASGAAADDAFHETIAAAANNPYLQRVVNFVSAQFSESRRLTWAPADHPSLREHAQGEHHKLFEAIVAGDAAAARRCAAAHLDHVESRLIAAKTDG